MLTGAALAMLSAGPTMAITGSWSNPTISGGAITDDPALANFVTNDLLVNVATGSDWTNASLKVILSGGSVYNVATGTEGSPNPTLWSVATLRNTQYDSFVNSKNFGPASILGRVADEGPGPARGVRFPTDPDISIAWGDTIAGEDGSFSIGRFTLSNNAQGAWSARVLEAGGGFQDLSGTVVNGQILVPEPATLSVLALMVLGHMGVRRRP
jgi:hypothetical protein